MWRMATGIRTTRRSTSTGTTPTIATPTSVDARKFLTAKSHPALFVFASTTGLPACQTGSHMSTNRSSSLRSPQAVRILGNRFFLGWFAVRVQYGRGASEFRFAGATLPVRSAFPALAEKPLLRRGSGKRVTAFLSAHGYRACLAWIIFLRYNTGPYATNEAHG